MHDNSAGTEDLVAWRCPTTPMRSHFAGRVIRDIMHKGAKKRAGWTMNMSEDNRVVGTIPFDAAYGAKK